jgi:L-lactate dehydrogenase
MTDVILHDQRSLMSVCTPQTSIAGVKDVTVSMPNVVGGEGVIGEHHPLIMDMEEQSALHDSAALIRSLLDDLMAELG